MVGEDLEEVAAEVEEVRDSGTRTGAIAHAATRQTAAHHLEDVGARAMTVGVRAGARHPGGGSATTVLPGAVEADGGAAQAIRMPATGATAGIVAVAETVVDAGDSFAALQM